jgi:hypothetical protein
MYNYKLSKDPVSNEVTSILRLEPWLLIPFNEENADYQQYLAWVEAGNDPEPADEE